ncbi:MAG: ROK family protein [Anaerolineales bacterium]
MAASVYASVDLGGTKIACAFADETGQVLAENRVPTEAHEGPRAVVDRMATLINGLSATTGIRPQGVGIGVPGLADLPNGIVRFLPNLPGKWPNIPVRDWLSPQVGCPVSLLNDVRMATLGELVFGHGRTATTMAFFAVGTGIGGGAVVNKRLHLGSMGAAGEFGHLVVLPNGPLCGCGAHGCMEALASGPAISAEGMRLMLIGNAPNLYRIVDGDLNRVNPGTMLEAALAGDAPVRDAIERAAYYLGLGISQVAHTLHPDLVVIGGGVANIGDILFNKVRTTLDEQIHMFPPESVALKPSLLGDRAGMLGGIALAMKQGDVA